jgi:hypothetical protein
MFRVEDSTDAPLKEDKLMKQGRNSLWNERHFVLRREGVIWYENLKAYTANPFKPKGKILVRIAY